MNLFEWFQAGGFVMYPLLIGSLLAWGVIFERAWRFKKINDEMPRFQARALEYLLKRDTEGLGSLCEKAQNVPTAVVVQTAIERLRSKDLRIRKHWLEAVERRRREINQSLKKNLWVLGTIATASPFVGLFGTVVGILKSFHEMALSGKGGFVVVAAGISEALVATAAGIIVAVIASIGFNTFQSRWSELILKVKIQVEELLEIIDSSEEHNQK